MSKALKWYKLDNSAKIYPILTNDRYSYVFRVSATLKTEIKPEFLKQAIEEARHRFPYFYVRLKRGLFWYYFEENKLDILLHREDGIVCGKIDEHLNHGYLFKFMYYNKRISLEMNHVLTDGGAAVIFLKSVIYRYVELTGKTLTPDDSIYLLDSRPNLEESIDAYEANYSGGKIKAPDMKRAYFKKQKRFKTLGSAIVNSHINSNELKSLAKSYSATVTQFVVALITYSIIKTGDKSLLKKFPINICIPVNLRGIYHSKTLSNFSMYFISSYQSTGVLDFNDIIQRVKQNFKEEYTAEKIQSKLDTVYLVQEKMLIRIIPLFLKWVIFKIGYQLFGRKPITLTLSNFGVLKVPTSLENEIDSFSFYMGAGLKTAVAMNSFKDQTSIVFSRAVVSSKLEKCFFNFLTEKGVSVKIESNYLESFEVK